MQTKYTTIAKIKAKLSTSLSDNDIDEVIRMVSKNMDTYVGFRLGSDYASSSDFYVNGSGTEFLILSQPLYSYTDLVSIDLQGNTTPETYFIAEPLNLAYKDRFTKRVGKFIAGKGNYKVTGAKQGVGLVDWTTSPNHSLPEEITLVATTLAIAMITAGASLALANSDKSGPVSGETIGSYSINYAVSSENFTKTISSVPSVSDILNKYKEINALVA